MVENNNNNNMFDEESLKTYNGVFKLNYLVKVMRFNILTDIKKDNTLLIIQKGLKSFQIKYNRGSDLFDLELIKFNTQNKIHKMIKENKKIEHIKSKKELKGVFIDQLRGIFEDFFKVEVYNLI